MPFKATARDLGNGKRLMTTASSKFKMYIRQIKNHDPLKRTPLPGCQAIMIEIERGKEVETIFIEIRADLFPCQNATL